MYRGDSTRERKALIKESWSVSSTLLATKGMHYYTPDGATVHGETPRNPLPMALSGFTQVAEPGQVDRQDAMRKPWRGGAKVWIEPFAKGQRALVVGVV